MNEVQATERPTAVSVVIPAKNEAASIGGLVARIASLGIANHPAVHW